MTFYQEDKSHMKQSQPSIDPSSIENTTNVQFTLGEDHKNADIFSGHHHRTYSAARTL